MIGLLTVLVIVAAIVGGIAAWMRRSGPAESMPEVADSGPRRVSLLVEAVGYIGTILILAGAFSFAAQHWRDISEGGRLALLLVATAVFLGIGAFVVRSVEPAFQRLAAVSWAVSVAAFAGAGGMVNLILDTTGKAAFLTIATSSAAYALVLWRLFRHGVQQAVAFGGLLLAVASVINYLVTDAQGWMFAVPLWAIALAWVAAGWLRRLQPWFVAVSIGLLVGLIAPATIDSPSGLRFGLGIATATAVMGLAVVLKFTPALALAAIAELGYVIGAVTYYFSDTLGVPASLAIAGLLILTLAAVATRRHWFGERRTASPPPAPATSERQPERELIRR